MTSRKLYLAPKWRGYSVTLESAQAPAMLHHVLVHTPDGRILELDELPDMDLEDLFTHIVDSIGRLEELRAS
jgi:hypothetical protein